MLTVVINGVRKYFDRQQSRWIFPRSSVFHRGAQVWRDYLYTCTEIADSVSASRSGINKAAVSFVPHTFAIPVGPQQAKSCSPTFSRLQSGARQEAVWMFPVRQPAAGPMAALLPLGLLLCPAPCLLPGCWCWVVTPCLLHEKRNKVLTSVGTDILRKSTCFLRRCTGFGQKTVNLQNVCPKFLQYNKSLVFPFLVFSLRCERLGRIQQLSITFQRLLSYI